MADVRLGSILDFNTGISRVVRDTSAVDVGLPERRQITPTALAGMQQLPQLTAVDNIDALIAQSLEPLVESHVVLLPERFEAALASARLAVGRAMADGADDKAGLEALAAVLREEQELQHTFCYYRDMLIAG